MIIVIVMFQSMKHIKLNLFFKTTLVIDSRENVKQHKHMTLLSKYVYIFHFKLLKCDMIYYITSI